MTKTLPYSIDPNFDLILERVIDVPREWVWKAWTNPEQVMQWIAPAPWETVGCDIDLKPGGGFMITMRAPDGKEFPTVGCFLDVVPYERLVWTPVLGPGYRPSAARQTGADLPFTGVIQLESRGSATKYTAIAIHRDEDDRRTHAEMGFHQSWGKALDQLVAMAKRDTR